MGREVRRVPPDWKHPTNEGNRYEPLYDQCVEEVFNDWLAEYEKWKNGGWKETAEKYAEENLLIDSSYRFFCRWHGTPPCPDCYRPSWPEVVATWYQVYETVTEGTPVTPAFATPEELVDYLSTHGDYSDQKRGRPPWDRATAEKFVRGGFAPSAILIHDGEKSVLLEPRDQ